MKKRVFISCMTVVLSGILAGCAKEHIWVEASCTAPKTCTECGETEGEPLEHTWEEATCTAPKTCSVCGTTEGEPLEHTLTEANYQSAAVCTVCGETVGEPLQAVFEELGIVCEAEQEVEYDYVTVCLEDTTLETHAKVIFSGYQTFESDENHAAKEGYEWKLVTITEIFSDDNAYHNGYHAASSSFDYYAGDIEEDDDSLFTVNYNGVDYTECEIDTNVLMNFWQDHIAYCVVQYEVLVPIGYDGVVIAPINYANCMDTRDGDDLNANLEDIDENTVLFRLK